MNAEYENEGLHTYRKLRLLGYFIALMGITGLGFYFFDVENAQAHPILILLGTIFCIYGSWKMFHLANIVRKTIMQTSKLRLDDPVSPNYYFAWAVCGSFAWIFFGAISSIIFVYTTPLTIIPLKSSWIAIILIILLFAVIGAIHGLLGCLHSGSFSYVNRSTNNAVTFRAMSIWGAFFGCIATSLFFLMPEVPMTELRSIIPRAVIGLLAGFFSGSFMSTLAKKYVAY